jgi:hypothetical protein
VRSASVNSDFPGESCEKPVGGLGLVGEWLFVCGFALFFIYICIIVIVFAVLRFVILIAI